LNTMLLLPVFASSIRSLQAMYRISFMWFGFSCVLRVFMCCFYHANSLRHGNTEREY
jgi:hypothetical protein